MFKYVVVFGLAMVAIAAYNKFGKPKGESSNVSPFINERNETQESNSEHVEEQEVQVHSEIVEEDVSEIEEVIIEADDDSEEDYLAMLRAEEEAAEACYGNCMYCRHFCKDQDPEIVFGKCSLYNTDMLQDDGCYDYEEE